MTTTPRSGCARLDLPEEVEAVAVRKADVEQDDVDVLLGKDRASLLNRPGLEQGAPSAAEDRGPVGAPREATPG